MQSFTIRDVENLTGIKAHTLRRWEQRYGFPATRRKGSQHRIYDNEDLKQLLRISLLYHNGWKAAKIAALTPAEVLEQIRTTKPRPGHYDYYINRLIEEAVDFSEAGFVSVLNEASEAIGFEQCIVQIGHPYLKKLGLLLSANSIISAQEHFSSYIIQNRLICETERLPPIDALPVLLLAAPGGERHELPVLFINYLLRKKRRNTLYVGANSRKEDLRRLAALPSVTGLYLHLTADATDLFVDDYLEDVCRLFPHKTVYASGEGVKAAQRSFTNLRLLRSDKEIYEFIDGVRT